ncbi:hypothetical protein A2U01_0031468, partial [Trifolium medium]|nr:hypothetical protein [Trifolium medium]
MASGNEYLPPSS